MAESHSCNFAVAVGPPPNPLGHPPAPAWSTPDLPSGSTCGRPGTEQQPAIIGTPGRWSHTWVVCRLARSSCDEDRGLGAGIHFTFGDVASVCCPSSSKQYQRWHSPWHPLLSALMASARPFWFALVCLAGTRCESLIRCLSMPSRAAVCRVLEVINAIAVLMKTSILRPYPSLKVCLMRFNCIPNRHTIASNQSHLKPTCIACAKIHTCRYKARAFSGCKASPLLFMLAFTPWAPRLPLFM